MRSCARAVNPCCCMALSSRRSASGPRSQCTRTCRVDIWALEKILSPDFLKRLRCRSRAAITRVRISAEPSAAAPPRSSLYLTGWNLYMDIDSVEQRTGDLGDIALDHGRRAHALARFVVEISTGAGIHGGREHEARRKAERHGGAGDGDVVVFERLAHDFEHVARKLRQFVEEEKSVVGQGNFAGTRDDAATNEAGVGDGVMGRAERTLRDEPGGGMEDSSNGVDLGCLKRLFKRKGSKDGGQALGEHGLAGARRPDHEDVVAAGSGNFERALGCLLAADIFEVDGEMLQLAEKLFGLHAEGFALNLADDAGV